MQRDSNTARVGLTVLAALAALAAFIFMIGEQSALFTPTNGYRTMFPNAAGLVEGNPVQLNGVTVGKVDRILLSEDPDSELLEVRISVERRYAGRLRRDSLARLKTLGLLGDKYVEITSGSPDAVLLNPGDEIPAALPTDVDELIASGADAVDYAVATAVRCRTSSPAWNAARASSANSSPPARTSGSPTRSSGRSSRSSAWPTGSKRATESSDGCSRTARWATGSPRRSTDWTRP